MYSISIKELLKNNISNIIDIRSIQKYNDNHILNAINIQPAELITNSNKYLNKRDKHYIYCQKGIQSTKVCNYLRKRGYNVINIIGGYEAWILEK